MANVIAYYRTSTDEQQYGIEAQRADVTAYATMHGLTIVSEYEEHMSGKNDHRPTLEKATQEARTQGVSLIVAKIDRLTRHASFGLSYVERNKVVFCDHPSMGTLEQAVYFGMAQQEREYISARTESGMSVVKDLEANEATRKARREAGRYAIGQKGAKEKAEAEGREYTDPTIKARQASLEVRQSKARTNEANRKAYALVSVMAGTLAQKAEYLNANGFTTAKGGAWRGNQVKRLIEMYG